MLEDWKWIGRAELEMKCVAETSNEWVLECVLEVERSDLEVNDVSC